MQDQEKGQTRIAEKSEGENTRDPFVAETQTFPWLPDRWCWA